MARLAVGLGRLVPKGAGMNDADRKNEIYVHIDVAGTPGEYGERPVKIGGEERCPVCCCPVFFGFGLALGGFGPYAICLNEDECEWTWKQVLPHDEC